MIKVNPIEIIVESIEKLNNFNLKFFLNSLEMNIERVQNKVSYNRKINIQKMLTVGSVLLFLFAYNVTSDTPENYNNETPVGIFNN